MVTAAPIPKSNHLSVNDSVKKKIDMKIVDHSVETASIFVLFGMALCSLKLRI